MPKKALFIGRFQPFHLGHLEYIKNILKEHERLIICIGSSEKKDTLENPFSKKQRKDMIFGSLKQEKIGIKKIKILFLKDYPDNNEKWFLQLKQKTDDFDIYFAGENELTKKILKEHGYTVRSVNKRIKGISATEIRKKIRKNKDWKKYVPDFVYKYIDKIKD
ncbi:nicotinamide-nucleotide adenylyltransferase [Candidatus Woesearchaeota archaeon]|nr:nicotinamide-nucleotide adenylyltransferase [Candidatus Woesearchaeota archaeon]